MARLAFLLAVAGFLLAAAPAAAEDRPGELRVGEVTRSYLIHLPARPAPEGGYPLVLAFHGGGGQGSKMAELTRFDPLADARGFIVIYPDGLDRHWNDGRATIAQKTDDVGFVSALLDEVERLHPVDRRRVFAAGLSNGAIFTERLGCELSGRFAAIAAVSGTMAADLAGSCHPARPISVLQIAGSADPIMPYQGGTVGKLFGRGEGGTVLSAAATADLWGRLDACPPPGPPVGLPLASRPDGTSLTRQSREGCEDRAVVTLLTVWGGGHAWPGGPALPPRLFGRSSDQLDTSRAVIDFFLGGV